METEWLCPDCWWQWVQQAGRPAQQQAAQRATTATAAQRMWALAPGVRPGAGQQSAERGRRCALIRRARRWLTHRLRSASWLRRVALVRAGAASIQGARLHGAFPSWAESQAALEAAVGRLLRERRVWCHSTSATTRICWRCAESEAPPLVTHIRRRRHYPRRRGANDDEPPALRRRMF